VDAMPSTTPTVSMPTVPAVSRNTTK
jgi:hypothetical protein